MTEDQLTIIIPTLATEFTSRALTMCLDSLYETSDIPIIVAINGNAKEAGVHLGVVHERPNGKGMVDNFFYKEQGQCHAVNRALKEVTTPWVMVANDDMIFPPGWFEKMAYAIEHFGLLVASPNLVEPRRGAPPFLEYFCGGIGTEGTVPDFNKQQFLYFAAQHKEHPNKPHLNIENGFNLPFVIRTDVMREVGGYDEAYDPWGSCSDTDLQTRLMIAGITPKRVRNALVYHFGSTSGTFSSENESFRHDNWRYYKEKFGFDSFKNPDVWYLPTIPPENKFHPEYEGKYASHS